MNPTGPQTDSDWTIHSLNIHGEFFERWCAQIVRETRTWTLTTTNYPVAVEGHQSSLDIRADAEVGNRRLVLLVECKKNNPEFVDWIFFPKDATRKGNPNSMIVPQVTEDGNPCLSDISFTPIPVTIADGARETRGSYQDYSKQKSDKTKTSNTAITDAAKQIALAAQFVWNEERRVRGLRTIIIPVIVTTANILLCKFNPQDVLPETGEIQYTAATLEEHDVGILVYEYPVPTHLQPRRDRVQINISGVRSDSNEPIVRREIIVVPSRKWSNFLKNVALQPAMIH